MKKIIFAFAVATISTIALTNCSKSNPITCTEKAAKVQAAAAVYVADDKKENCLAYKAAIQDYVNSCATSMTADQKAQYEAMIADMNCP